ncbi:SIR2 family protein [Pectobacterium carotovorum]|uniref:SIR2 family protein n=1 Tax=Pectobacterium carotovorum TaxID=554 RepID=UPI00191ED1D7|nr:SIR2 family protein [Pectobacterium carotovorum]MBL0908325.1 SIR2 family protein [Pectobacterium carotovorum]
MTLDSIKKHLQEHFSDGLVTIIGSGLSCAEGLPGMGELAKHLSSELGNNLSAEDAALWKEIKPLLATNGLEAALLAKAPTATLEAAISFLTGELVVRQERQVIAEVFNGQRKLRLTRLLAHLLKPSSGLPIVTTNYDRLVEIAVEEAGVGADTMFVGRFSASLNERESKLSFCRNVTFKKPNITYHYRTRALICKPHGSLDWYFRDGKPVAYSGELDGVPRLIITPGQNKFRNGYESPFDHHRNKANDSIDRASRFLILGYGFNDDHLETHLSPAIRGGKPTLMLAYSLTPNATKLALEYASVTALESHCENGVQGTRLIINKKQLFIPKLELWDVHKFIDEVLEP